MPQKKEKQPASPSTQFIRKVLRGPISQSTEEEWPELARHWASAEINMPEETSRVAKVRELGPIGRAQIGDAYGGFYPTSGTIGLNRDLVTKDNMLRDVLVHELTHAGQNPGIMGMLNKVRHQFTPYTERPEEKEALAAERNYPWREKGRDTYLPSGPLDTGPTTKTKKKLMPIPQLDPKLKERSDRLLGR